jgi:hypothetical protein
MSDDGKLEDEFEAPCTVETGGAGGEETRAGNKVAAGVTRVAGAAGTGATDGLVKRRVAEIGVTGVDVEDNEEEEKDDVDAERNEAAADGTESGEENDAEEDESDEEAADDV